MIRRGDIWPIKEILRDHEHGPELTFGQVLPVLVLVTSAQPPASPSSNPQPPAHVKNGMNPRSGGSNQGSEGRIRVREVQRGSANQNTANPGWGETLPDLGMSSPGWVV